MKNIYVITYTKQVFNIDVVQVIKTGPIIETKLLASSKEPDCAKKFFSASVWKKKASPFDFENLDAITRASKFQTEEFKALKAPNTERLINWKG